MLYIIQIIIAVLLIGVILLQQQEGGLGSAFGGSASFRTKQGLEKVLVRFTATLIILFVGIAILLVIK